MASRRWDDASVAFDLDAYLERIGHRGPVEPTVDCLDALHLAHVCSIPFENLDILLGRPIRLDLESLQAKLVRARRGGYCFEQNTLFAAALETIGFGVTPLAARVRLRTREITARSHMTLRVDAGGSSRLADVGFGGASILRSLPIEPGGPVDQFGWRFRLVEGDAGRILQGMGTERWWDFYSFTLERQYPIDFEVANHYTSTHPESRFVKGLTVQLPTPAARTALRNRELTVDAGGATTSRVMADDEEIRRVLQETFGLPVPGDLRFP
jgi:N-hydroxyarylamine O-acetyltransferase